MRWNANCLALAAMVFAGCTTLGPGTADRLYVFAVGECHTTDLANWSAADAGKPWVFANHCYLIRHGTDLLLWDTGFSDELAKGSRDLGSLQIRVEHPLAEQLEALGVRPDDVTHLALSHLHLDHAGNANLFPNATLYLQRREHEAGFGPQPQRFGFDPATYGKLRDSKTVLLDGDHDVFGDGSVVILSTPGHTPGHQSLLVRLRTTGAVVLSGDIAHLRSNWQYRRTPASNFDREQSVRSMARIQAVLERERALLVIHHDRGQSLTLPKAPGFLK